MAASEEPGAPKARHVIDGEYTYKGVVYGSLFPRDVVESVPTFPFRDDDVILATYPKCGTSWMQEILDGVMHCDDVEEPKESVFARVPFLEIRSPRGDGMSRLKTLPSPRIIKTHMGKDFFQGPLDRNIKFVIVLRNPKDAIVSYFHYYKYVPQFGFKGDFNEFFELYRDKQICYGDFFDWVLPWWEEKDNPNVLVVFYEDMKADIHRETRRVADFLGKTMTDDMVNKVVDRGQFDKMKATKASFDKSEKEGTGQFRKGVVGDWRSLFTEDQCSYVDGQVEKYLSGTGLFFKENQ